MPWTILIEVVLRGLGYFLGFMGNKKESQQWLAKVSDSLMKKGWVRQKFVLELEASRDEYINNKLKEEENAVLSKKD